MDHPRTPSNSLDLKILASLARAYRLAIFVVLAIAGIVLAGWTVPGVASVLPPYWDLMRSSTALCVVLAGLSLRLIRPGVSRWTMALGRGCATAMITITGLSLTAYLTGWNLGVQALGTVPWVAAVPGLMSPQSAVFLLLFGISKIFPKSGRTCCRYLVDAVVVLLVALPLVLLGGYAFGAMGLVGPSPLTLTSPQTLACLCLLAFVRGGQQAEHGVFAVLVGIGIGSRFARAVLPLAIILPYLFTLGNVYGISAGLLAAPYAAALTAAFSSLVFLAVVIVMAHRINLLERDLRDMSLTDELTQSYNRRGFQLLGEQAMREARRNRQPLTVLFLDLDGLKQVNDTFGHDVGSQFVVDVAALLHETFRDADITARVGGDEFAVVLHSGASETATALHRLDAATAVANDHLKRPYRIAFSIGSATAEAGGDGDIAALIAQADAEMYRQKKAKRAGRSAAQGAFGRVPARVR